jgi:hypothetical protein
MDATGKVATLEDGKLWTKVKASRAASARKTAPPAKKETALALA